LPAGRIADMKPRSERMSLASLIGSPATKEVRAIEPQTLYMRFAYATDPASQVAEMIQLSPDGQHRARTWHWLRDGQLWRITLVRERRTSRDVSDW